MMKNKISSPYRKLKLLLILPVMAMVLYAFARPEYRVAADGSAPTASEIVMATQQNMVKGTVTDPNGDPLPGASVVVQGTTVGTVTDAGGKFTFKDLNRDAVIVVSFVGFETQAVKAASGTDMNIKMMKKAMVIDTVTVPAPPPPPPPPPPSGAKMSHQGQKAPGGDTFVMVEEMPQFPGGQEEMIKWLGSNIKYPPEAKKAGIQGAVIVGFVVNSTGKVMNVKVRRSVNPLLDAEAVRVIESMPDWSPGKQHGKSVDVDMTVPIQFRLQ